MRPPALPLIVWSLLLIAATWVGGVRHDYIYYVEQWQLVLSGADPWSTNNAYGPLHNLFALLLPLHPLAPKLAQALLIVAANLLLVRRLDGRALTGAHYAIVFGANPLLVISAFWYGNNDGLVAALVLAAALARHDRRLVLAGVLLGLAALDKFYPLLLVPFFALEGRRIEARLVLSALVTLAAGLGIGTLIWGGAMLEAMVFGVSRDATMLSILHTFAAHAGGTSWAPLADLLIRLNAPVLLVVWGGAIAMAWWRRENWLVAAVLGLAAVLIVYKVGHPQFWVCWLALLAALPLIDTAGARQLMRLSWPFALFLALFQLGFEILPPYYYRGALSVVKDNAGAPAFVLVALMLALYVSRAPRPSP